ncbi:hypothetical protein GH714_020336 [Hevea brasiliensis]|uniref:NAC domain-containing protein n=1 Tax=Hevea brasiliensis TaxID=3981 RepID=A0A6A6M076_HEVBR|nr:hypothetical protein GH714_020336 [Hevea brasiliensis]
MTSTTLPSGLSHEVGEGFRPNDKELVNHFLKLKLLGYDQRVRKIPELNIYKFEPWDLPQHFGTDSGNPYWYFFCPRNNGRPSRTTEAGYWKATGRERMIKDANEVIGETSCPITSTTKENLPDDGIPKEVHPELPTHPESLQPWNDQNYWLNSASEWPMQAEQGVYNYCEDDVFSGLEPLFCLMVYN